MCKCRLKIYMQTKCLFCVTCNMIKVNKVTFVNSSVNILLAYSSRGCIMYNKVHIIHEVYQTFQTNMDCAQEMLKARRKWTKLILRTIFFHL